MTENDILRRLLWLNHGCTHLYGDDGEMQCNVCRIDFKRMTASDIRARFAAITLGKIEAQSPPHPEKG